MNALVRTIAILLALAAGTLPVAAKDVAPPDQIKAGEAIYTRCLACHALAYDRTGPRHCGLFGRRAGSVKGFAYSTAMQRADIIWNARTLDRFLANPTQALPGTSMGYAGVTDASERAALIAYLRQANSSAECSNSKRQ